MSPMLRHKHTSLTIGFWRRRGEARILRTRGDFSEHMQTWSEATNYEDLPVGMVLGMEGADPILWPEHVHEWWGERAAHN